MYDGKDGSNAIQRGWKQVSFNPEWGYVGRDAYGHWRVIPEADLETNTGELSALLKKQRQKIREVLNIRAVK